MKKIKEADKKLLASAARKKAESGVDPDVARSLKATTASKAAINPTADAIQKPQTAARIESNRAKVEQTRIARSGIARKRGHLSAMNKRNQGKRNSK